MSFSSLKKILHGDRFNKELMNTKLREFASPVDVKKFTNNLLNYLSSNSYKRLLEKTPILICINTTTIGKSNNLFDSFEKELKSGITKICNCIEIDIQGNIIDGFEDLKDLMYCSRQSAMDLSKESENIYIYLSGMSLSVIYNGCMVYEIANVLLSKANYINSKLTASDYKILIEKHYKTVLDGEIGVQYWSSKKEWLLLPKPEGLLQKSLAFYLDQYIADGYVIEECLNKNSTDRTDITICLLNNKGKYIIEVKWIGKSKGSAYDGATAHKRANEGIQQLKIYIDRDKDATRGVLLVYDARKIKESIKWGDDATWDKRIDKKPVIVKLNPLPASTRAKVKS